MVRERYRAAAARQINRLESIASGKLTVTVLGTDGEPVECQPAIADQLRALDQLAKYGVGTQQEVDVTSGGQPLTVRVVRDA